MTQLRLRRDHGSKDPPPCQRRPRSVASPRRQCTEPTHDDDRDLTNAAHARARQFRPSTSINTRVAIGGPREWGGFKRQREGRRLGRRDLCRYTHSRDRCDLLCEEGT